MTRQITITLDEDVAAIVERAAERSHRPVEEVANDMLRKAPEPNERPIEPRPFVVRPYNMGTRPGVDFTCISKLLDQVEGPDRK